ncbi:hypothetical protein [Arthrobacter sp. 35W]|uniref:hypothetical protein n=1 Tax=Arthrobacter sp. 35W TaxID=1132441 RepID=UPI00047DA36A|nr:hypothetical protein [Arthrobacter sp. 35W]
MGAQCPDQGARPPGEVAAARIHRDLSRVQLMLATVDSQIRSLLMLRSDTTARALADRVPVAAIAKAASASPSEVRIAGCGHIDLDYAGRPKAHHLAEVAGIASELTSALERKAGIERGRRTLIIKALRSGQLDIHQIAAMAGLATERVQTIVRGAAVRGGRTA